MRIDIQDGAIEELDRILKDKNYGNKGLRIHVAGIG